MNINLIGPPASGKSTFAARFVTEHPEFKFCPIDEYRIRYENETIAWSKLEEDLVNHKNTVLESCGFNWRLVNIFNLPVMLKRPVLTIALTGVGSNLELRLHHREKREVPFEYNEMDEIEAIRYVIEHLTECSVLPVDFIIDTNHKRPEYIYKVILATINTFRINFSENEFKGREKVHSTLLACNI